jgi:hypothetical protein
MGSVKVNYNIDDAIYANRRQSCWCLTAVAVVAFVVAALGVDDVVLADGPDMAGSDSSSGTVANRASLISALPATPANLPEVMPVVEPRAREVSADDIAQRKNELLADVDSRLKNMQDLFDRLPPSARTEDSSIGKQITQLYGTKERIQDIPDEEIARGIAEQRAKEMAAQIQQQREAERDADEQAARQQAARQSESLNRQMVELGFVEYQGRWMTAEEKNQILLQIAQAQREVEARKRDAYKMSQEFVKDQLKSPSTAQFLAYEDSHVIVTYDGEWYLVSAMVDSENGFGATVRTSYICKLKFVGADRTGNENWQAESTVFPDE